MFEQQQQYGFMGEEKLEHLVVNAALTNEAAATRVKRLYGGFDVVCNRGNHRL